MQKENAITTTLQPIGTHLTGTLANLRDRSLSTLPATHTAKPNPLLLGETPLRDSVAAQNELTRLLEQTYSCQKTYADKAEMMEYRDGMFQIILAEYAFFEIKSAFLQHVRQSPDLPTPSDIVKLIEADRKYRLMEMPSIEKLLRYRDKGIALSQEQKDILSEAGY